MSSRIPGNNDIPEGFGESFRSVMASPHPRTESVDVEGILARVHEHMAGPQGASVGERTWLSTSRLLGIAAALIIIVAGTYIVGGLRTVPANAPAVQKYSTRPGQTANVTLPNGARVTLAPATRIQVSGSVVDLEGEALFSVIHDNEHPFIVRTNIATTRVLGTSFSVRAYAADKFARVVVESGRVAMGGAGILNAGDVARVTETGEATVHRDVDVASLLSWRTGVLTFNREQVRNVVPELERWYNIPIVVENPAINNLNITATLRSRSIENLLAVLQGTLEVEASWNGKVLTLR